MVIQLLNCYFLHLYVLAEGGYLKAGIYTFPFTIRLPPFLPASFEGQHGRVMYWAKAYLDRPWKGDTECKKPFTVKGLLDLNTEAESKVWNLWTILTLLLINTSLTFETQQRSFHLHELEDVFAMIPPKENVIFFNTLNCIQLICLLSSKDKYYVRTYVETINIFPT